MCRITACCHDSITGMLCGVLLDGVALENTQDVYSCSRKVAVGAVGLLGKRVTATLNERSRVTKIVEAKRGDKQPRDSRTGFSDLLDGAPVDTSEEARTDDQQARRFVRDE